jgi:hypothetical protein
MAAIAARWSLTLGGSWRTDHRATTRTSTAQNATRPTSHQRGFRLGGAGGGWYGAAGEGRFEPPLAPPPLGNMRDAGSEMPDWAPAAVDGGGANLRAYKQMRDRVTGPDEALPADGGPEAGCRAPCLPSRKKPAPEQAQLPGR